MRIWRKPFLFQPKFWNCPAKKCFDQQTCGFRNTECRICWWNTDTIGFSRQKKINYHDFGVHVDASFMDLTLVFKPLCLLEYKPYDYGELDPHSSLELHFHAESTQSKWNDWRQLDKGPKAPSTFVCQRTKLGSRDHLLTLLKNYLTSAYAIF